MHIHREERIAIAMLDTIEWLVLFLGAIKAGIVPVALNTLLTPADYEYQLNDSRARALFYSAPLARNFEGIARKCSNLKHVVTEVELKDFLASAKPRAEAAPTLRDEMCFWL